MPSANLLFTYDFAGASGTTWPGFDFGDGVNPAITRPALDGKGHGVPSVASRALWRMRATSYPLGRSDYKADFHVRWTSPGTQGGRSVGGFVRFRDWNNYIVARVNSEAVGSLPSLKLYKRENGGSEVQLGSTYTGAALGEAVLYATAVWRVRVQDLADGTTRVRVFLAPNGGVSDGTSVIDTTTSLDTLRGPYTVGVELGALCGWNDVRVHRIEVYDFADEWNPGSGADPDVEGSGWFVELGSDLYAMADLWALSPKVTLRKVRTGFGVGTNTCELSVEGRFTGGILHPGLPVRVFHEGVCRFAGELRKGERSARGAEQQRWTGQDSQWLAQQVYVGESDGRPRIYNVEDEGSEDYNENRQAMTCGAVLQDLFDSVVDENEGLRFYGAAPASGLPYVADQLAALDAIVPNLAVSGNFLRAIQTVLRFMPNFQVWVNPVDRVWHFRDITALDQQTVSLTEAHVQMTVSEDADSCVTAYEWIGANPQKKDPVSYSLSSTDPTRRLRPAWTQDQEGTWRDDRGRKRFKSLTVLNAGYTTGAEPGLVYCDVSPAYNLTPDEWRGAVASGGDSFQRWCVGHTSTRIFLSSPLWAGGSPPSTPFDLMLDLVDASAIPELSAKGVGRAFFFPVLQVCGTGQANPLAGFLNQGNCGNAIVTSNGDDGEPYSQEYMYRVHYRSAGQRAAGLCEPVIVLAAKPKPALAWFGRKPPPGGSPPEWGCDEGGGGANLQGLDVEITVSETLDPPRFREPEEGYRGEAYSDDPTLWDGGGEANPSAGDWNNRKVLRIVDPEFTSDDQIPGLRLAAAAALKVLGQKARLFRITIATDWFESNPLQGIRQRTATSVWGQMTRRVTVESAARTTGYENIVDASVYSVTWDVEKNTTELEAGTAAGWLQIDAKALSSRLTKRSEQEKAARLLQRVEDYRIAMLSKNSDRVMGQQAGQIEGCQVVLKNENTRRVTTVELDDQNKEDAVNQVALRVEALERLLIGPDQHFPGAQLEVPGFDGAGTKQVAPSGGPVLEPPGGRVGWKIPFRGPTPGTPNSDRGRYGGLPESSVGLAGASGRDLMRRGGFQIRRTEDATGNWRGAHELEVAALGATGTPGSYSPMPDANAVGAARLWAAARGGSYTHMLKQAGQELARQLGAVLDAAGKPEAPGTVTASHPDGVPGNVGSDRAVSGLGAYFQVVRESLNDPGGLVYHGPMIDGGADAGLYWRVLHPEGLLVRVDAVTPGSGSNGGAWDWNTDGPGGSYEWLGAGDVIHKQIHASEFVQDNNQSGTVTYASTHESSDPFSFPSEAVLYDPNTDSGIGAHLALPQGVRGSPMITAVVGEDPFASPAPAAGQTFAFKVSVTFMGSSWRSPETSSAYTDLATDGSATGIVAFRYPAGAVDPGQRRIGVSIIQKVGAGSAPSGTGAALFGIGVEVARVLGGYLLRIGDAVGAGDSLVHSHPWMDERANVETALALELSKVLAEAVAIGDSVAVELNPPIVIEEAAAAGDALALTVTKALAEGVGVGDAVSTELNP